MANNILVVPRTPLVWANLTDYAGDGGTRTHQLDLTTLTTGTARQGDKADISTGGSAVSGKFARRYIMTARIEVGVAPQDGETIDFYWAASLSNTATTANPGGTTGSDAAYTGTAGSLLEESLLQLQYLGSLMLTNDASTVIQQQSFLVTLPLRYGMPVVYNNTSQSLEADAIDMSITFTPLEDEVQ